MSWIDVAILAVVVLVGLIGVLQGVKKSALALGAFLVAFILAFFLSTVIAEALLGIGSVKSFVLGSGFGEDAQWSLANWIYSLKFSESYKSSYVGMHFYQPIMDIINSATNITVHPDEGFALYGAFMIFSGICGVGLFIVIRFLLIIVTGIIKSYIGKKKSVLSRLLGFVLGAVRGAAWMLAFTIVFSCIGGYTPVEGIANIQNEYEHNAVICGTFNDVAYEIRNKLLLPNADAYGRLVDLVYKEEPGDTPEAEKLSPERLNLFVAVSNLNYKGARWSVDEQKKRKEDKSVEERTVSFAGTGFSDVAQAILEYNKSVAQAIDDTSKLNDVTDKYAALTVVANGSLKDLMNSLWTKLSEYETHYNKPDKEQSDWMSKANSTLQRDYEEIDSLISQIKSTYAQHFAQASEDFPTFPELTLPAQKKFVAGEEGPGEQGPGEEDPGEQDPGEQDPGEQDPGEQDPGEEDPGEEDPGEQDPGEE